MIDQEPSSKTFEELLSSFPKNSGPEYDADEFDISYTKQNMDGYKYAGIDSAVEALSQSSACSIEVWMDGYGLNLGFDQSSERFLSNSSYSYLRFATTIYVFRDPDDDTKIDEIKGRRRKFVETLANAADILEPTWGFGRRGGLAIGEDDGFDDLVTRERPPLYEYNVFRPTTVDEIERERLLSAPAWYVKELEYGGVFLAAREPPKQCSKATGTCSEIADHLGTELASPERYY